MNYLSTITEADEEIRQKSLKRGWHPVAVHYQVTRVRDGKICNRRHYAARFFKSKGCCLAFFDLDVRTPVLAQTVADTLNAARAIGV